jgi:dnd system-associated protein 4
MSSYRVKRPKKYNELLDLLRHKEEGVFDSLKSALIFAAGIGFKNGMKSSFVETGEPIAFSLFNTQREQPFVLAMGLHESDNIEYLRDENFLEVVKIFEEYACGGLEYLEGKLDQAHIKEEIEGMLAEACNDDFLGNIANEWSQN